jgi:hypothetical protein
MPANGRWDLIQRLKGSFLYWFIARYENQRIEGGGVFSPHQLSVLRPGFEHAPALKCMWLRSDYGFTAVCYYRENVFLVRRV